MENSVAGGSDQRRAAKLRYYDYSIREARQYGQLYRPKGKAFGASIWSKPVNGDLSKQIANQKKTFLRGHLSDTSLEKYMQIT